MANSDKTITITPATGTSNEPSIAFNGGENSNPQITMYTHSDGTLSYESGEGQQFSITDSLTGEIFSVADISGIPAIRATNAGLLQLNPHQGNILVGTYDDNVLDKMQVHGTVSIFGETGQLFSVVDDATDETIYSVNDMSGIPSIRVKDNGDVYLTETYGKVGVGTNAPSVTKGMQIEGGLRIQHRTTYPNNVAGNDGVLLIAREDTRDWGTIHLGYHDYGLAIETSSGAAYALAIRNTAGYVVRINGAGDVLANSHGSISDQRLKENITPLTNSLQTVMSLRGVNFTWIQKPEDGVQVGLIAQEVEAHVPSVVQSPTEEETVMPDGSIEKLYKHVEYGKLVPLLIEAIKEQQQMIDDLKTRLDNAGL
jgi:hypothetical protein